MRPGRFSVHFFLQLTVILVTRRAVGRFGRRALRQPLAAIAAPFAIAMLVLMAIVTMMMASALFKLVGRPKRRATGEFGTSDTAQAKQRSIVAEAFACSHG